MTSSQNPKIDPGFWLGLLLFILLVFASAKCSAKGDAKIDTVRVEYKHIKQFVTTGTEEKPKVYAVYQNGEISDMIPVNKTTFEYIKVCNKCGLVPTLGIRFRNGSPTSLVRYKRKYRIR